MVNIFVKVEAIKDVKRTMVLEVDQVDPLTLSHSYQMSCPKYFVNMDDGQEWTTASQETRPYDPHPRILVRRVANAGIPMNQGTFVSYTTVSERYEATNARHFQAMDSR